MRFNEVNIGQVFTLPGDEETRYRKVAVDLAVMVDRPDVSHPFTSTRIVIGPRNRFDDAVEIQEGAVNVLAIANALVRACKENRDDPKRTTYEDDSAIRMMLHQLCFLAFHKDPATGEQYMYCMKECRDRSIKYCSEETNG